MEITIKEPNLNNKEFTFTDSVRNQKAVTRVMRDGYKEQVDALDAQDEPEVDTSKMSYEEQLEHQQKQVKKSISDFNQKIANIDSMINTFAGIFGLKGKTKYVLEDLSLDQLGQLLAHVSIRMNNPMITEEQYWELIKSGESKKSQPEEG